MKNQACYLWLQPLIVKLKKTYFPSIQEDSREFFLKTHENKGKIKNLEFSIINRYSTIL